MTKLLSILFGSLFLVVLLDGCAKAGGTTPPGADNPTPGVVDDAAGFYVRPRKSDDFTYYQHKGDTTYGTDCIAVAGQRLDCYVEAEELDLYFNGVALQYNVPTTMCKYLLFSPYFFYQFQPGNGPTSGREDTDKNGTVGVDADSDGVVNVTGPLVCAFDYTQAEGPNCCEGFYTKTTRSWNSTSNAYDITAVTPSVPWGGKYANCLAGPAMDTQTKDKNGRPRADLVYVSDKGINAVYEVMAPIKKAYASNVHAANYFDIADHAGNPPIPVQNNEPYYRFDCLDRAHEVISEIRVIVREWNTEADFLARETAPNNHSLTVPPEGIGGYPINDYRDWKEYPATYPMFSL